MPSRTDIEIFAQYRPGSIAAVVAAATECGVNLAAIEIVDGDPFRLRIAHDGASTGFESVLASMGWTITPSTTE